MATTIQNVKDAWNSAIFEHGSIQALTTKIYDYDVLVESEKENSKLYFAQEINFCVYRVERSPMQYQITRGRHYDFNVTISYYKEYSAGADNQDSVSDFFETLDGLVTSELGISWDGVVTYMNPQKDPIKLENLELDKKTIWKGQVQYTGRKIFTI